ncbi:glucuronate isomerase [Treponema brennaborense]|uniref:Uronate isomerase n=1 Tax=Treponema brennaborense (strain DSM 12168 / CIP 105900 / DD5/3) TaxID=906968 RepID=F4LK88_TREBD|nr:glucuronate isomerase [Treponema brennaborense]AEE15477.1 Uronate isomerase [Treponema brennaborense DSM 12168]
MKRFMDADFLLETETARKLFREAAADQPIWDFHCHLIPAQIAANKKFAHITEIWLGGDHYKWRQMRTYGIDEKYITGDADPYDKFLAWAETVEHLIGNPLYHWTHLELQRYFGIYEPLTRKSAPAIWKKANELLATDELSVKGIFEKMNVYAVGTTDDPIDTLEYHEQIASGTAPIGKISTKVLPSFRPDKAINIGKPDFAHYIEKLAAASGVAINSVDAVVAALVNRLDFFIQHGCRASDHALDYVPFAIEGDANKAFHDAMRGQPVSKADADTYKTAVLARMAEAYAKRGIVMQYHIAAIRDNNGAMYKKLGPDTGYDAVHDHQVSENLAGLLNYIESAGGLPKTVLYTLNPKDYYPLGTLIGCYQGGGIRGKIQLGSAWWFCDHKDGMEQQMKVLGNLGMLSAFVGMLTDSRSFLSYPRHEYFRRILCNIVGTWVENGEYPADEDTLKGIVSGVSFTNALAYFGK